MIFDEITTNNFIIFAIKYYENPTATTREDFEEDLKKFKYIKRWFKKYHETGEINSHLVLNHIIVIFNCWDDAAIPLLFHKVNPEYWSYLKTFMVYIDRIPTWPHTTLDDIPEDINIKKMLAGI